MGAFVVIHGTTNILLTYDRCNVCWHIIHFLLPPPELEAVNTTLHNLLDCKETSPGILLHKFWWEFRSDMAKLQPYVSCLENITGWASSHHCHRLIESTCTHDIRSSEKSNFTCLGKVWIQERANITSNNNESREEDNPFTEYKRRILSQAKDAAPCFQMYNDVCRSNKINVINPLAAGAAYIRIFIFYEHINYHLLIC